MSDLPSDAEVARINTEHLISTPLRPADLLFVFGQRRGDKQIAEKAIELWQRGLFRHAIVSGGPTQGNPRTECSIIKDGMVSGGVPGDLI
ncbi:MAG TPA: YdcF family protein, partial [Reyranella sp.]|nr:YdcF family protein [Reyranella sp.]